MSEPQVVVHRDASLLAQAVAARIIVAIVDAQAARGEASIVLTGGGIGGATLRELSEAPARAAIDWPRLSIWWGD
jgi:6-phosphogluconolactonase